MAGRAQTEENLRREGERWKYGKWVDGMRDRNTQNGKEWRHGEETEE